MPIVDLMSIQSTHFAKLREFIQMQLPAGFPVKIGEFAVASDGRVSAELGGQLEIMC